MEAFEEYELGNAVGWRETSADGYSESADTVTLSSGPFFHLLTSIFQLGYGA
jgi:hypothetical protein